MEDTLLAYPTAQDLYEMFEKMPPTVREEFKAMIRLPKKAKKKYADDTEYLMSSETTHQEILASIKNVRERKNLTSYSPEEWDIFVKETLEKLKI